jgi:two-component system KDP operon response regulator KdpE
MISVNGQKSHVLQGFNLGADDYIIKPFHFPELVARIQSVLRRAGGDERDPGNDNFHNEELDIDWRSRQVWVRGEKVGLSPTEFRLLACLIENRGWVVTHEELLRKVWGPNYWGDRGYTKLYIRYLRQKIEKEPNKPRWILTERGVGYRFLSSNNSAAIV